MAIHIEELSIKNYRGIRKLSLSNLGDINIIVGNNNSGKTSVLESLLLISNPSDFSNVLNISRMRDRVRYTFRGSPIMFDSFLYLFNRNSDKLDMELSMLLNRRLIKMEIFGEVNNAIIDIDELSKKSGNKNSYQLYLSDIIESEEIEIFNGNLSWDIGQNQDDEFSHSGMEDINYHKYVKIMGFKPKKSIINTVHLSIIDHIVDNTFRNITKDSSITRDVVEVLNTFDDDIIDLKIVEEEGKRYVQTVESKSMGNMPLSVYGDGIKKVIAIANAIVSAKDGILLIDEIETSIHKSAMLKVYSWMIDSIKRYNVQLFITTHSMEVVDEMLASNELVIENDMIRVITLVKKENETVARVLTGEKAMQVREDYDMELRI